MKFKSLIFVIVAALAIAPMLLAADKESQCHVENDMPSQREKQRRRGDDDERKGCGFFIIFTTTKRINHHENSHGE